MGSSETIGWAAAPERKYPFLVTFSGRDLVARYLNLYREQAKQYGYEASGDQLGWARPVYVADTDERARGGGAGRHRDAVQRFPGGAVRDADAARLHVAVVDEEHHEDAQGARAREAPLAGGADGERHRGGRQPADRARRARRLRDATGANNWSTMLQFGVLTDELTKRNMEMFATEVMPHLRN